MLKKLQNLLFEEEEEEIIEEVSDYAGETASIPLEQINEVEAKKAVEQVVQEVKEEVPVVKPAPAYTESVLEVSSVEENNEPKMQRIDVTQAVNTQESVNDELAINDYIKEEEPPVVEKPKTLGITADDNFDNRRQVKKPSTKPSKKDNRETKTTYQFQPVISPIFGVDEKDLTALKNTTTRISQSEKARSEENVTPIISPMYGKYEEDVPSSIQKTVEQSNYQEQLRVTADKMAAEDDIPEFSLDDILSTRDDEIPTLDDFIVPSVDDSASLFPDLWSTELEDAEDSTSIIDQQPVEE